MCTALVAGDVYFDIQSIGGRYGRFVGAVDPQGEPGECWCEFLIISVSMSMLVRRPSLLTANSTALQAPQTNGTRGTLLCGNRRNLENHTGSPRGAEEDRAGILNVLPLLGLFCLVMNPINAWEFLSLPSYTQTAVNEATFTAVICFLRGIVKWATAQPVVSAFPQFVDTFSCCGLITILNWKPV